MVTFNGQEHTLAQFRQLLELSGWRIVNVTRGGQTVDCIEAVPA